MKRVAFGMLLLCCAEDLPCVCIAWLCLTGMGPCLNSDAHICLHLAFAHASLQKAYQLASHADFLSDNTSDGLSIYSEELTGKGEAVLG